MTSNDWNSLTSATAAAMTSLVFLQAASHKAQNVESFSGFVRDYQIVPMGMEAPVSRALIAIEIFITGALMGPGTRDAASGIAISILSIYAAAMAHNIVRGRKEIQCGCGAEPQWLGWPLVVRNVILIGVAALALRSDESPHSLGAWMVTMTSGFVLWISLVLAEQILANFSRAHLAFGNGSV
jgi:hypothetical protein